MEPFLEFIIGILHFLPPGPEAQQRRPHWQVAVGARLHRITMVSGAT